MTVAYKCLPGDKKYNLYLPTFLGFIFSYIANGRFSEMLVLRSLLKARA